MASAVSGPTAAVASASPPPAAAIAAAVNGSNSSNNVISAATAQTSVTSRLGAVTEACWFQLGALWESCGELDRALLNYEGALRQNPYHVAVLTQMGTLYRIKEMYPKAIDYFQRVLSVDATNGDVWGALGHCFLMLEDLPKAYAAYQKALLYLTSPKDPNLWYGIGILYDRYGSFDHAEDAFNAVLRMDPQFEKRSEVLFRLGLIYKNQSKLEKSLDAFKSVVMNPPPPLHVADIYFQIGHVHELKLDFADAKNAYEQVLKENPGHSRVLQQLGWLYHHHTETDVGLGNQEIAISYLMRSIDADASDGQTWYLLGRCYMSQQKYRKAYDAYQQAVYRDGNNPTFWRSIGILYYQIAQFRDALDAFTKAIRLNPYLSDVWADLGALYEACSQRSDALDAFQRASELDPSNRQITQRLAALQSGAPLELYHGASPLAPSNPVQSASALDSLAALAAGSASNNHSVEAKSADAEPAAQLKPPTSQSTRITTNDSLSTVDSMDSNPLKRKRELDSVDQPESKKAKVE